MKLLNRILSRVSILSGFLGFLWKQGKIILLLTVVFVVIFGLLIFVIQSQVAPTPFIYTLF